MNSEEILTELRKIIRALNLESKRIQKKFGISIPQLLCLIYLSKRENHQATTKSLSEALNLNPSTISGIVSRLEKKGYVARLPKRDDKRMTYITLTAVGAKLIEASPMLFHEKLDKRLSRLSDIERNKVQEGLMLITGILELEDMDAAPMLTITDNIADSNDNNDELSEPLIS